MPISTHTSETDPGIGTIEVLFCADNNYVKHLVVTIRSLLINNSDHYFNIYILLTQSDGNSRQRLLETTSTFENAMLHFLEFNCSQIFTFENGDESHVSLSAYARLFMADYLDTSINKILYLDCDVIVRRDIFELWNTSLGNCSLAAVPDPFVNRQSTLRVPNGELYYNSGVMVVDVKRWRQNNYSNVFNKFIEKNLHTLQYHDQDVINAVLCDGNILPLSFKWNFFSRFASLSNRVLGINRDDFFSIRNNPHIVHFTSSCKPWIYGCEPHYKSEYFKYLPSAVDGYWTTPSKKIAPLEVFWQKANTALKWRLPGVSRFIRRVTGTGDPYMSIH